MREYNSLLGGEAISRRWHSASTALKVALLIIVVLALVALAFMIATIVLASRSSEDSYVTNCPVRALFSCGSGQQYLLAFAT